MRNVRTIRLWIVVRVLGQNFLPSFYGVQLVSDGAQLLSVWILLHWISSMFRKNAGALICIIHSFLGLLLSLRRIAFWWANIKRTNFNFIIYIFMLHFVTSTVFCIFKWHMLYLGHCKQNKEKRKQMSIHGLIMLNEYC